MSEVILHKSTCEVGRGQMIIACLAERETLPAMGERERVKVHLEMSQVPFFPHLIAIQLTFEFVLSLSLFSSSVLVMCAM